MVKHQVINTTVSQILLKILKTELLLLILIRYLLWKVSRLQKEESEFVKYTFVNIFDFVNESQSLIRKVSTVKEKVCC